MMYPPRYTLLHARKTPGWQAVGLLLLLVIASARFASGVVLRDQPLELKAYVLYQAATLGFNYFEFGAIRRGLGGSIVHLISLDTAAATIVFHFLTATGVAATAALLFARSVATPVTRAVLALTVVTLMLRWGDDAGRADMAVAFMFGCTAIAFQRKQPALGTVFVAIGLFVHETSFIFGLPLLAGLALQAGGWSALPQRQRLAGAAVLASSLVLYAGMNWLPHADVRTMVSVVRGKFVAHEHVEWAIYYALSGMRGVRTSICQNLTDPSYWVHPTSGLVVIGAFALAVLPSTRRAWWIALLAALPGFFFLVIVANDASRWAVFACFNIWLVAATSPVRPGGTSARPSLRLGMALALLPLILLRPGSVSHRIYAPSPLLERAVLALGGARTPSVGEALQRCDPAWKDVLDRP